MAMAFFKVSTIPSLIFLLLLLCNLIKISETQASPTLVAGLSYTFYRKSCPKLESIIRKKLQTIFSSDIGQAAGLPLLHFSDCFVQGSVLLDGSASEKDAPPNLTLRAQVFVIIENLRSLVHKACGPIVSCSDITALAARDAVVLMSQLSVLTGNQGEMRYNCSRRNSNGLFMLPNMEKGQDRKLASY
ncbi:hypothetical protein R6Q57_016209 [Mikania cordata]